MRKTKAQLQAELDAANKRCADLADALVKAIQAQPVYYPVPYYYVPAAAPQWPMWYGETTCKPTWQWNAQNTNVCAGGGMLGATTIVEVKS